MSLDALFDGKLRACLAELDDSVTVAHERTVDSEMDETETAYEILRNAEEVYSRCVDLLAWREFMTTAEVSAVQKSLQTAYERLLKDPDERYKNRLQEHRADLDARIARKK